MPVLLGMLLLLGALGGCVNTRRGDTVYRVQNATVAEDKAIRRQLWRVGKATEDVRMRYALDDITVLVTVRELGGLGETTPTFSGLANISGAAVVLNERLFLEDHPEIDQVLTGLMAHELMHALHYARMPRRDLLILGRRYQAMLKQPNGPQREWVRAYERFTDMMVIRFGYGDELIYQKRASEENLTINDPALVWDFYLTEPEIRAMLDDPALLEQEIRLAAEVLNLPSVHRLLDIELGFDEHGDLIPLRRADR